MIALRHFTIASIVALSIAGAASAQDTAAPQNDETAGIKIGRGVVCDTEAQARRFAALYAESGADAALKRVNSEAADQTACAMMVIAFRNPEHISEVSTARDALEIVKVTVVAAVTQQGWQLIDNATQYAAVKPAGIA